MYMLEENEIYNSIVEEFQLSTSILNQSKENVEALIQGRINICKLLKISKYKSENLNIHEKDLLLNINIYKGNIRDYEKRQVELNNKIIVNKSEMKVIKLHINELEGKINKESEKSKKLRESLRIFLSREKFKTIKSILLPSYRKVFLKYSDELNIKGEILESNKRKEKIREEKQSLDNRMKESTRKITMDKKAISPILRKSIINMQKCIGVSTIRLQGIEDYKEMENKFCAEIRQVNNVK